MSDLDQKHEERGEVTCEGCGCWTATYTETLDECPLCPTCGKDVPLATPQEIAEWNGDVPALRLVDAPPRAEGTAQTVAEPWAVYCTTSHHVQRCYATFADAEAYCADLNRASRIKSWVVVDSRIIASGVAILNEASPAQTDAPRVTEEEYKAAAAFFEYGATRGNHDFGETGHLTPHINTMGALVARLYRLAQDHPTPEGGK